MAGKHGSRHLNTDLQSHLNMEEGENFVDAIERNYHFVREAARRAERGPQIRRETNRDLSPSQQAIAMELGKQHDIRKDNARLDGDISHMIQREAQQFYQAQSKGLGEINFKAIGYQGTTRQRPRTAKPKNTNLPSKMALSKAQATIQSAHQSPAKRDGSVDQDVYGATIARH